MVHLEEIFEIFIKPGDLNTSYVMVHQIKDNCATKITYNLNTSYVMVHRLPKWRKAN